MGIPQLFLDAAPIVGEGHIAALFGPTVDQAAGILLLPFKEERTLFQESVNALPGKTVLTRYTK
jgi:hypothetical protein